MKRKWISLFCILLSLAPVFAQKKLKKPLTFVSSDSILLWAPDRTNLQVAAWSVDERLKERPVLMDARNAKDFKKNLRKWNEEVVVRISPLGTCIDSDGEHELATARMVDLAVRLFQQTADSRFTNALERVAFNYLLRETAENRPFSFEKRTVAQTLLNILGTMYATDKEGVYVNYFLSNTTHIKTAELDFRIDQMTALPFSNRLKIRITGLKKGQTPLTVRFRMPDWALGTASLGASYDFCSGSQKYPEIYVNGRSEQLPLVNGYVEVRRKWNNGDEIYLDFPFDLQVVHETSNASNTLREVYLQRGPSVYVANNVSGELRLPVELEGHETDSVNQQGHPILEVRLKNQQGLDQDVQVEPFMDASQYGKMSCGKCETQK